MRDELSMALIRTTLLFYRHFVSVNDAAASITGTCAMQIEKDAGPQTGTITAQEGVCTSVGHMNRVCKTKQLQIQPVQPFMQRQQTACANRVQRVWTLSV